MKHWDFISGGKTFSFSATNEFSFVMFGWFHSIEEFTFEWNLRIVLIFSFRGFQLNLYRIGKNLPIIQTMSEIWTGWWATTQQFDRLFLKKIRYSSRWWYSIIARWIFLCVHEQALTQSKGKIHQSKKEFFLLLFSCGVEWELKDRKIGCGQSQVHIECWLFHIQIRLTTTTAFLQVDDGQWPFAHKLNFYIFHY